MFDIYIFEDYTFVNSQLIPDNYTLIEDGEPICVSYDGYIFEWQQIKLQERLCFSFSYGIN